MIVAFPYSFQGFEKFSKRGTTGPLFVRANKELCPRIKLVQVTDAKTVALKGVDECCRVDAAPFGVWYFAAAINFPYDEYLRIDSDVVVRRDVSEVWDQKFDIAIADERGRRPQNKLGIHTLNAGVMFVRNRDFFRESLKHYEEDTGMDNWQDLQIAMQMTINAGDFLVHRLAPVVYNYYPKNDGSQHPEETRIIHYKGDRKLRMIQDYAPMLEAA